MKKSYLFVTVLFACISMMGFTPPPASNGVLYIKIKADGNKGNVHLTVRSASSTAKLVDVQLSPGQTFEKTLTGLPNGPQSWYSISFDWPGTDFHNMAAGMAGTMIATGFPVTGNNMVSGWQVAGTGAFGSVPVLLP